MDAGHKLVILFQGRDAAGKCGVIRRITQRLNARVRRVAALLASNDRKRTRGYFQHHIAHLPAAGEIVLSTSSTPTSCCPRGCATMTVPGSRCRAR